MMKALRRPVNWQDFEELCKRLWAEIWQYPETKKHGRTGQPQFGVDIYGKHQGKNGLIGIQCKGKDEYTDSQLTKKEIDLEVEKASLFKPPLEKLYFATTSTRSTSIEEYVREKNELNIAKGLFSIHVFFWEDIVELIDQNKFTHDWYVNESKYSDKYNVSFLFESGQSEILVYPKFRQHVITYRKTDLLDVIDLQAFKNEINSLPAPFGMKHPAINTKDDLIKLLNSIPKIDSDEEFLDPQPIQYKQDHFFREYIERKESTNKIKLTLKNIGSTAITDVKVILRFNGPLNCNSVNKNQGFFDPYKYDYNVWFEKKNVGVAKVGILVHGDTLEIDEICFISAPENSTCIISWELFSKDFQTSGELKVEVRPQMELDETDYYVDVPTAFTSEMIRCSRTFNNGHV